jgi:aspartyl-tRNA(Asn)/glutamyl-tRNA(Gln) amidotransferase subunit B
MRSKEEAHDYRYFPEPDLLPLDVERAWIEDVARALPEMPHARSARYQRDYGLSALDAEALVVTRDLAEYFDAAVAASGNARAAANWVRNDVLRVLNDTGQYRVTADRLGRLIRMIDRGAIGGKAAKEVFEEMAANGGDPESIVEKRGLGQISDAGVIRDAAARVIERHPSQVADYRGGKQQIFGFLVGQLMKEMRGKADAKIANDVLRELLAS